MRPIGDAEEEQEQEQKDGKANADKVPRKNVVVVGDGGVGKTSLLFAYQNGALEQSYTPTVFAKSEIELTLDGRTYPINFHDTAGHEEFEKVRQVFYKTADAVLLCYATDCRSSFANVEYKWCRELQKPVRRRGVPVVLVATKSDLRRRSPTSTAMVTTGEGIQLCNRINASAFLECSASAQANIAEVIYEAVRAAVRFGAGEQSELNSCDKEGAAAEDNNTGNGFCLFARRRCSGGGGCGGGDDKGDGGGPCCCKRDSFRHWFTKCF